MRLNLPSASSCSIISATVPQNSRTCSAMPGLQFAFTREEIAEAGRHLGIVGKKLDGVSYVMRPHNLVAIWWAKPATAPQFIGTASEGNAA